MILEQINQKILEEYKGGDEKTRVFLQTLKAGLINKKIDLKHDLTQEEEIAVLKSELKKIEESGAQYESGGRNDLADKARDEAKILREFLPEGMKIGEIEEIVKNIVANLEDKSFGNAMKAVMIELKGKADGSVVSAMVKKFIDA